MTAKEPWEFFAAHSEWLGDHWARSPEGREYKDKFDTYVAMLRHEHYVLELLLAAGHVTLAQIEKARALSDTLADAVANIPRNTR